MNVTRVRKCLHCLLLMPIWQGSQSTYRRVQNNQGGSPRGLLAIYKPMPTVCSSTGNCPPRSWSMGSIPSGSNISEGLKSSTTMVWSCNARAMESRLMLHGPLIKESGRSASASQIRENSVHSSASPLVKLKGSVYLLTELMVQAQPSSRSSKFVRARVWEFDFTKQYGHRFASPH